MSESPVAFQSTYRGCCTAQHTICRTGISEPVVSRIVVCTSPEYVQHTFRVYATWWLPEIGCHATLVTPLAGEEMAWTGVAPLVSIIQIWLFRTNTICVPSGDQSGHASRT